MTETRTYGTSGGMPRAKQFPNRLTLPLTDEMLARTDAALVEGEARVELIRQALDRELKRRERQKG